MKKKLQFLFSLVTLLCVGMTANAQEIVDGKYYLQNVATGLYWGAANSWGTQASLLAHPDYVTLVSNEDGTYSLESQVSNGGTNYYFTGSYMDGAPVSLTITQSGDYYTIANGETYYGAAEAGTATTFEGTTVLGTPAGDSEEALWKILSAEEMAATLATATESNPVDATFLITDHTFGRNHRYVDAWTNEGGAALTGGNSNKHTAEKYHGSFNVYQTLANAPAGVYKFTAQGFYRQDGTDNDNLPVFYANEKTAVFPVKTGTENSMADACTSFEAGLYPIAPIYVQVTEDGELTVGCKLETNGNLWCIWDNFVLTYYGPDADIESLTLPELISSVTELRKKATELKNNPNVAPETVAALEAAIESANDIQAAYYAAIAALEAANKQAELDIKQKTAIDAMYALLESTNVYTTEAYNAYKAKADDYLAKFNEGTLTEIVVNPLSVQGWRSANDYDDLLLSAWSIGDEQCKDYDKSLYINTWSTEGDNDGTEFKVPFFEYFTGDDASLGVNTLTATMEGLTPGTYKVTAWVRNQPKKGVDAADVTGITLQVNDGEAVDVTEGEAQAGFNIGEFSAVGVVGKDGKLLIKVNVTEDNNSHWLSFKNVKFEKNATFAGIIEQTVTHPTAGVMGTSVSEQTVKIAEAGEGLVDITFSGFTMPMPPTEIPEFTISNVVAETAADGSITYTAGNFQVAVPMGAMSVPYNGTLEGVQASAEATPLFKLVLQNATTDEIYFGADQDAIDAYKASFEPEPEIAINVERIVKQGYAAQTESFDFTEAAELLGVDAITEDMLRVVEADGTLNSDIAKYDGWFNKDGYAQTWGDYSFVCVKLFQAIEDGKYEICDMNNPQVDDEVTAKWAVVNGEKTVYININVKFIKKPVVGPTLDDLNKLDEVVVSFTSECGKSYEGLAGNVDMTEILDPLGVDFVNEVDIYAVQSDGSLDNDYKLGPGTIDGWRNADGDWQSWGADARFYVKVNFAVAENQIYEVGGMDGQNTEPAEYTATFAFVKKGTHNAVVLKVKLIYDNNVNIDGIDAAKAKGDGKYLQDGKIVIVKNGKTYSVSGVEIK